MRISDWSSDVCSSDLNVQNRTDEQRVAGFLPVISALERPFRIDENIGDILNVANLVLAATDLEQRVVFGGRRIGRIEQHAMREAGPEAGGQRPGFTCDNVNDGRSAPAEH